MKTQGLFRKFFFGTMGIALLLSSSLQAATFVVNNTGDGGDDSSDGICEANTGSGDCTLRAALGEANDANDTDEIVFDPAVFPAGAGTVINTTSQLLLNDPVTITGPGVDTLTIENDGTTPVFIVDHADPVTGPHVISGMTITGGNGGIHVEHIENDVMLNSLLVTGNASSVDGGGIFVGPSNVSGTVTISNCTISGNSTTARGGGLASTDDSGVVILRNSVLSGNNAGDTFDNHGGGIVNAGGSSMTIENSTLFDNFAGDSGGGIANLGANSEITMTNSTIGSNQAQGDGGGIFNDPSASNTVTLLNVTLTGNISDSNLNGTGEGGGLSQQNGAGAFTVTNSIIAGNTDNSAAAADDCFTETDDASDVVSGGNNFLGDIVGCGDNSFDTAAKNDQVGDSGGSGALDPMLASLDPTDGGNPADGSATGIHLPLENSPVIDAVEESIADAPNQDQRGAPRPIGSAADIGAVESGCGNGIIETGEDCDDGGESAECDDDCTSVSCGDGNENSDADEECDDGNTTDGDGCSSTCTDEDGNGGGCSLIRS